MSAPALAALGVVYGDIGTSPLYALKECFSGEYGVTPNVDNVLGILSIDFWTITWVVVFKYLIVLMQADNEGEGGIMALIALLTPAGGNDAKLAARRKRLTVIFLGLFGAALLYGDGVITPAVSVLSAVEGLEISGSAFHPFIVPLTVGILIALFAAQKKGTERVGMVFGPIMLLWFATIAAIALPWIFRNPMVLEALNPLFAIQFFLRNGIHGFLVLTAVVLCVTGAEALYADMGHFGPGPIKKAWFFVVFPSLVLNYFGQGAMLLEKGSTVLVHPFYSLAPSIFLYPLVLLATIATVIASQALISGVFSMTQQASLLGFLPMFRVIHTSESAEGQIYIPKINLFLLVSCIALVLGFQSSENLTGAYGIAVTGTMTITSLLFYRVSRYCWKWPIWRAGGLAGMFLAVDFTLLIPNGVKIFHGGWVPILIAVFIFILMTTWHRGHELLAKSHFEESEGLKEFVAKIENEKPHRTSGTGVFLTRRKDTAPGLLLYNYKLNQALPEHVILIALTLARVPYTSNDTHGKFTDLGNGFYQIVSEYGFMQRPRIDEVLQHCQSAHAGIDLKSLNFYVGRDMIVPKKNSSMALWRKALFAFVLNNSERASDALKIKPELVVEIGAAVEI
jgi:KUP system potassium uptake protein